MRLGAQVNILETDPPVSRLLRAAIPDKCAPEFAARVLFKVISEPDFGSQADVRDFRGPVRVVAPPLCGDFREIPALLSIFAALFQKGRVARSAFENRTEGT